MLDHLLKGRLIMGISPGGLMSDAEVFGNYQKNRIAMFVESINMVLKIWESEPPYDLQGEFFKVSTKQTSIPEIGQGSILKPYQKPHPPIVGTAVAPFSQGVTEMAKRGWTPIPANFLLPEWVKTPWPKYVEGREAVGAKPSPAEWRVALRALNRAAATACVPIRMATSPRLTSRSTAWFSGEREDRIMASTRRPVPPNWRRNTARCCRASSVVGAMTATCRPVSATRMAACSAISVLPKPTSPQTSRIIGRPLARSCCTARIARTWSRVSGYGRRRAKPR